MTSLTHLDELHVGADDVTKWLAVLLVKDERLKELENAEHVRVEQQVVAVLQLAPLVVRSTLQHGGQQRQLPETPSHSRWLQGVTRITLQHGGQQRQLPDTPSHV